MGKWDLKYGSVIRHAALMVPPIYVYAMVIGPGPRPDIEFEAIVLESSERAVRAAGYGWAGADIGDIIYPQKGMWGVVHD